jgi:hypothetical protein
MCQGSYNDIPKTEPKSEFIFQSYKRTIFISDVGTEISTPFP